MLIALAIARQRILILMNYRVIYMKLFVAALFLLLAASPAFATQVCDNNDCLDFEKTLAEISAIPGIEKSQDHSVQVFSEKGGRTLYIFSLPNTPIHPSFVKRSVVVENKEISIRTQGYTGAPKEAFEPWFAGYKQIDEQIKQEMKAKGCKTGCKPE